MSNKVFHVIKGTTENFDKKTRIRSTSNKTVAVFNSFDKAKNYVDKFMNTGLAWSEPENGNEGQIIIRSGDVSIEEWYVE